jgi:dihydrofolate reductase
MAKLIYSAIASLDGYVADEEGKFDWAEPDEEVHAFVNELERSVGTYLYGRRMYETMAGWETDAALAAQSELMRDFAQIWQAAEKSSTPGHSRRCRLGGLGLSETSILRPSA